LKFTDELLAINYDLEINGAGVQLKSTPAFFCGNDFISVQRQRFWETKIIVNAGRDN
jgi:hypothetical protein